jgi:hypothetical protein
MEFNLFDHLNLIIETGSHRGYEKYFRNEYRRIAAGTPLNNSAPTVIVKIVDKLPSAEADDIRRSVHCKKLFTFNYLVRGINSGKVLIWFETHFVDRIYINAVAVFLQAQVLEPIMYLKLLKRDVLFMHAGGVCDENNGYLFPAHGGTGKTTFSIALLSCGYRLLGDDLLIVDIDRRKVHPYPRPLHLFTYNIANLRGAAVPLKYQVAIYTKNVVRFFLERALRTDFLISTRVHADEIFEDDPFGRAVPYQRMFFLTKEGPRTSVKAINASNSACIARELMASADLNASLYNLLQDEDEVHRLMQVEEKLIRRLLNQLKLVTYVNTRQLDLSDLSFFVKHYLMPQTPPADQSG